MSSIKTIKKTGNTAWPVQGTKRHMERVTMMKEGRRIFEKHPHEENREDWIRQFNKVNGKKGYGMSGKRIEQFVSGDVKGRVGDAKAWHEHWIESVEKYQGRKRDGLIQEETVKEEEQQFIEITEEQSIDRSAFPFDKRIKLVLKSVGKELRFINKNKRKVEDTYATCMDIISDFQTKVNRWEGEWKSGVDMVRVEEILALSETQSSRSVWMKKLGDEGYADKEELLQLVEGVVFGGASAFYLDEVLLGELVVKCLRVEGLEDVGLSLFKISIACGEHYTPPVLEEYAPERVYETASKISVLLGIDAEPLRREHRVRFTCRMRRGVAAGVGVRVCSELARLRKGSAMLWASHVVVQASASG